MAPTDVERRRVIFTPLELARFDGDLLASRTLDLSVATEGNHVLATRSVCQLATEWGNA